MTDTPPPQPRPSRAEGQHPASPLRRPRSGCEQAPDFGFQSGFSGLNSIRGAAQGSVVLPVVVGRPCGGVVPVGVPAVAVVVAIPVVARLQDVFPDGGCFCGWIAPPRISPGPPCSLCSCAHNARKFGHTDGCPPRLPSVVPIPGTRTSRAPLWPAPRCPHLGVLLSVSSVRVNTSPFRLPAIKRSASLRSRWFGEAYQDRFSHPSRDRCLRLRSGLSDGC